MHPIPSLLLSFLLLVLGEAPHGWLGVYLAADRDAPVIAEVLPDSPAQKAGLRAGDVILAVGEQATPTREKLVEVVAAAATGDRVTLKVQRDGQELAIVAKLGARPEAAAVPPPGGAVRPSQGAPAAPAPESAPAAGGRAFLGVAVRDTDHGVVVDRVVAGSPASAAGVQVGDRLQSLADQPIRTRDDLERLLSGHKPGTPVSLGLGNEAGVRSVLITPGSTPGSGAEAEAPAATQAPVARPLQPRRTTPKPAAESGSPAGLEAELEALRQELRELRRQLEELRRQGGRE